ncbi:hypothetical protein M5K25_027932 [Dendrobium thyrsiflorum]|uniref:Uncharacterized protein n=1 Tax=Dendrobium thyrsiflorum TaxID=117978 RepID=A0ABD0TV31_DENTH
MENLRPVNSDAHPRRLLLLPADLNCYFAFPSRNPSCRAVRSPTAGTYIRLQQHVLPPRDRHRRLSPPRLHLPVSLLVHVAGDEEHLPIDSNSDVEIGGGFGAAGRLESGACEVPGDVDGTMAEAVLDVKAASALPLPKKPWADSEEEGLIVIIVIIVAWRGRGKAEVCAKRETENCPGPAERR